MDKAKGLDRRVARTRRSLVEALISLSLEFGYVRVTIRDVAERADVGYATFFRHFRSKDELATYCLRAVFTELIHAVQEAATLHEESLAVFTGLDKHRDACLFGLSLPRDHPAIKPIWDEITHAVSVIYSARDEATIPFEVSVNHVINSALELIRWWLTEGQDYSIEQMAIMQSELIIKVTETVALDHRLKSPRDAVPD